MALLALSVGNPLSFLGGIDFVLIRAAHYAGAGRYFWPCGCIFAGPSRRRPVGSQTAQSLLKSLMTRAVMRDFCMD